MKQVTGSLAWLFGGGLAACVLAASACAASQDSVLTAAEELESLHKLKQWDEARELVDRLLAEDRERAAQVLGAVLRRREIATRSHIIVDIASAGLTEAVPVLVEMLSDEDPGIRSHSASTLGRLGDRSAVGPLRARLKDEPCWRVRYRMRSALAELGEPYLQYFMDGLSDRNGERRRLCTAALGHLGDPRAVPVLIELLDSLRAWEPLNASRALEEITGIECTVVTKTVVRPDGSVNRQGHARPRDEFKADCMAWLEKHKQEALRPVEKSPEPWGYTPEPELPGLKVSFTMSSEQVIAPYAAAGLECEHQPEELSEDGRRVVRPETVAASESLLATLNDSLIGIRYIFREGQLEEIAVTAIANDTFIDSLREPLQLQKHGLGSYRGLEGKIVVWPFFGDSEKTIWMIQLNLED